jgi:pimeloyl-ACP methyl ester carboxylesterase
MHPVLNTIVFLIVFCAAIMYSQTLPVKTGYAPVNGLKMYYEIHGDDSAERPLVLIHGGGSTIQTSFGTILPELAKHRRVIAVELQGHGHTADIDRPESFERDADDVAGLMRSLNVEKADFLGFSNGGSTALQIAIRHPELVKKLVVIAAIFKRDGMSPGFWNGLSKATLQDMPVQLKEAYLAVAPNPKDLHKMFEKDRQRMLDFKDWPPGLLQSIESPVLVMVGDRDIVQPEHAVELYRLFPNGRLIVLPGAHGEYIGEAEAVKKGSRIPLFAIGMIEEFLDESVSNPPGK